MSGNVGLESADPEVKGPETAVDGGPESTSGFVVEGQELVVSRSQILK